MALMALISPDWPRLALMAPVALVRARFDHCYPLKAVL